MLKTASELLIRVGEDQTPIHLTDSAVEAVQGEAAGRMIDVLAGLLEAERAVPGGEGFASLDINQLIELRDHFQRGLELAEVLIDCRPMDDLDPDDDA